MILVNKRQAKKAFKKKYGVNPGQYEKDFYNICNEFNKIIPAACQIIRDGINNFHDNVAAAAELFKKSI